MVNPSPPNGQKSKTVKVKPDPAKDAGLVRRAVNELARQAELDAKQNKPRPRPRPPPPPRQVLKNGNNEQPGTARPVSRHASKKDINGPPGVSKPVSRHASKKDVNGPPGVSRPVSRHASKKDINGPPGVSRPVSRHASKKDVNGPPGVSRPVSRHASKKDVNGPPGVSRPVSRHASKKDLNGQRLDTKEDPTDRNNRPKTPTRPVTVGKDRPRAVKPKGHQEAIHEAWGMLYDMNNDIPNFYLIDEKGTFWLSRRGEAYLKNKNPIFDQIVNQKLFKFKQETQKGGVDVFIIIEPVKEAEIYVDGVILTKKKVIKYGKCELGSRVFDFRLKFEAFYNVTSSPELACLGPDYRFLSYLGKGGFALVIKGLHVKEETFCAIKIPRSKAVDAKLEREDMIFSNLSHVNIIKFQEFVVAQTRLGTEEFLITEFAVGGSLEHRVNHGSEITEVFAKRMFTQLFSAVAYIHAKKIIHRDLKPANIVLSKSDDETCVPKLIDFGLACFTTETNENGFIVGDFEYMAPEVITKKLKRSMDPYTDKVDIWGLGVCLFFTLNRRLPFQYDDDLKIYRKTMIDGKANFVSLESYNSLSNGTKFILENSLQFNEKRRPAIQPLLKYPWHLNPIVPTADPPLLNKFR